MKLYGFAGTRSQRALGLKELDADFEFISVNLLQANTSGPNSCASIRPARCPCWWTATS